MVPKQLRWAQAVQKTKVRMLSRCGCNGASGCYWNRPPKFLKMNQISGDTTWSAWYERMFLDVRYSTPKTASRLIQPQTRSKWHWFNRDCYTYSDSIPSIPIFYMLTRLTYPHYRLLALCHCNLPMHLALPTQNPGHDLETADTYVYTCSMNK